MHLELLEAFTWLHNRVYKEEAFSEIFGEDPEKDLWWRAVIEVAVARFGIWWEVVNKELKAREEGEAGVLDKGNGMKVLPRDLLPPLDVLMVWHSYMLNPRRYNEDCIWFGMSAMMNLAFPYEHIVCCTCCPTHLKYSRLMVSSMKPSTTINGIINSPDMLRGTGRGSPLKRLTFSRKFCGNPRRKNLSSVRHARKKLTSSFAKSSPRAGNAGGSARNSQLIVKAAGWS